MAKKKKASVKQEPVEKVEAEPTPEPAIAPQAMCYSRSAAGKNRSNNCGNSRHMTVAEHQNAQK